MKETNIYTGGKNPNPRNSYNGKIRYQKKKNNDFNYLKFVI